MHSIDTAVLRKMIKDGKTLDDMEVEFGGDRLEIASEICRLYLLDCDLQKLRPIKQIEGIEELFHKARRKATIPFGYYDKIFKNDP